MLNPFLKGVYFKRSESKFLFTVDPFSEEAHTNLTELPPLKVYRFTKYQGHRNKGTFIMLQLHSPPASPPPPPPPPHKKRVLDELLDLHSKTTNHQYPPAPFRIPQPSCLTRICPTFANSVDPDQLASEEANWSGSALFAIKNVNLYQQSGSSNLIGWKWEMGVAS